VKYAEPAFAPAKPEEVFGSLSHHGKRLSDQDQAQARRAPEIVSNNDVFVPVTVVLEAEWVLGDAYELPRDAKRSSLRQGSGRKGEEIASSSGSACLTRHRPGANSRLSRAGPEGSAQIRRLWY
jgi:hypothetical protein